MMQTLPELLQTMVQMEGSDLHITTNTPPQVRVHGHLTRLEEIMRAVCADFECELVEFNGEDNHVHLLVNFPPKVALARLVNSLKGVSSRRMRQEFPDVVRHYYRANKLWSGSYFAGSVGGAPLTVLRQYIEQQNRPG